LNQLDGHSRRVHPASVQRKAAASAGGPEPSRAWSYFYGWIREV
jgi:hypothetical protein